jgi:peptidoglycan/LPS O-acetylase OafA/YrhL
MNPADPWYFFTFLLLAFLGLGILSLFFPRGGRHIAHGLGLVCFLNVGLVFSHHDLFGFSENLIVACIFLLGVLWYYSEYEASAWGYDLIVTSIFVVLMISVLMHIGSDSIGLWQ